MKELRYGLIILLVFCAGCAGTNTASNNANDAKNNATAAKKPVDMYAKGTVLYTLTNLHPDTKKHQLYSSNFLLPDGLMPRCTAVTVVDKSKKRLTFSHESVEYDYDFNPRSNPEGFDENLKMYFGRSCDKNAVKKLSALDQKGIKEGKAYVGMSKQGVIYAIGYPPVSPTTADTNSPVWKYFRNRFNTMNVEFKNGVVSKIVD